MNPLATLKALVVIALVALLSLAGWHYRGLVADREELTQQVATQAEVIHLIKRVNATTNEVLSNHVKTVTVIKERATNVQVEIEKLLPLESSCVLPPAWRVLHDSAALNVPVPTGPSEFAPRAVTPQEAARTIAENYEVCHINTEQLRALQHWLKGVSE